MKRFTDTAKWDDPWFRSLQGAHKLVFLYIIDRCNNAGFWEYDEEAVVFHTKLKPELVKGAVEALARGLHGASGWVWVRNFLKHQKNDELNPSNPAHRQLIGLIRDQVERFSKVPEFQAFIAPYKGLLSPIGIGIGNKEGEVQERKPRKSPQTVEVVFPENLNTPEFKTAWEKWRKYRIERGLKPYVPMSANEQLRKLSLLGEGRALAAIDHSISQQYQGIFEESQKPNGSNGHSKPAVITPKTRLV